MKKLVEKLITPALTNLVVNPITDEVRSLIMSSESTITIIDDESGADTLYKALKMIYKINPAEFDKHSTFSNYTPKMLLTPTTYYSKLPNDNFCRIRFVTGGGTSPSMFDSMRARTLSITFYGDDRLALRDAFNIAISTTKYDNTNIVFHHCRDGYMTQKHSAMSFDDVIINDDTKTQLTDTIDSWNVNKAWFKQHKLTHKLGILLYGNPGTGKTSIAKAVSTYLNCAPIVLFNCNDLDWSYIQLKSTLVKVRGATPVVALIEDFDMFFDDRESGDEDSNQSNERTKIVGNQNKLMQLLDGMLSNDNVVFIATTNYINKIDPALMRPGRFDLKLHIGDFDKDLAGRYVESLGFDKDILDTPDFEDITYPIQPSTLKSKMIGYKGKKCNIVNV